MERETEETRWTRNLDGTRWTCNEWNEKHTSAGFVQVGSRRSCMHAFGGKRSFRKNGTHARGPYIHSLPMQAPVMFKYNHAVLASHCFHLADAPRHDRTMALYSLLRALRHHINMTRKRGAICSSKPSGESYHHNGGRHPRSTNRCRYRCSAFAPWKMARMHVLRVVRPGPLAFARSVLGAARIKTIRIVAW